MNKYLLTSLSLSAIFLLSSCGGSSPAPWSRPDDSPWKDKRASEASAQSADEVIYQPVTDPEPAPYEPMAPEPMAAPEPVAVSAVASNNTQSYAEGSGGSGMPAPESIEAEAMVVTASTEDIVMAMPATSYAVQVYAGKTLKSIETFQNNKGLDDLKTLKTDRGGDIYYVLLGLYDDRATANTAAAELEQKIGSKPWVRSMPGLQKIVVK